LRRCEFYSDVINPGDLFEYRLTGDGYSPECVFDVETYPTPTEDRVGTREKYMIQWNNDQVGEGEQEDHWRKVSHAAVCGYDKKKEPVIKHVAMGDSYDGDEFYVNIITCHADYPSTIVSTEDVTDKFLDVFRATFGHNFPIELWAETVVYYDPVANTKDFQKGIWE